MFCYYFSLEAVLQGMAKNNPTEKQTDAEIQATLKHAPVRKLTEGKMQSLSLQTAKIDLNYKLQLLAFEYQKQSPGDVLKNFAKFNIQSSTLF